MKAPLFLAAAAAGLLALSPNPARSENSLAPSCIYETHDEFFGTGDFDGDGRMDLVIVDKASGKYRLGYQLQPGAFTWVDCRPSGLKSVTGFSIGKVLAKNLDGFAFASPTGTELSLADASDPIASKNPVMIQFTDALGPSAIAAVHTTDPAKSPLADLYVGSTLNSPDPNLATLLRNDGAQFPKIAEEVLPGAAMRLNSIKLKAPYTRMVSFIVSGEKADDVRIEGLLDGKPSVVASLSGFTSGTDYAFASPGDVGFTDFLFYKPGTTKLFYSELAEVPPDAYSFGLRQPFDLGQPIQRVVTIAAGSDKSFIVFGQGETAGLFQFHRGKSSQLIQALSATNSLFTCALGVPNGFIAFTAAAGSNYSSKYQIYLESSGKYVPGAFGTLPTLADNDNVTIPEIYSRSVAANSAQSEKEMKPYTNTIPGTQVTYSMVPIPSGEFVMGSPKNEAGRKDDESPQHKVKISPFWMGQYEVTWNEYELFMFPDEERRTRLTMVTTDATGDKLADAVTHPSRPYVEMSFGMGKDNFPAISMTQHGANKYCQWLSAKTGHFYRLPTEAEWEYAARAGTTTTYFFGDDKKQLGDYAWFEDNSDFKYQKIGKKKPNPWGLYDIYGNVVEWVLDQYDPNFYKECATKPVIEDPLRKATKPYPHSVRGGSWDDPPEACRSAARRGSDKAWKATDPQLPKSIWYLTDAQWVGFRIVRPLKVPPPEQMQKYWNSGVEKD